MGRQPPDARGEVVDGRFRIEESLGAGAMGAVYRARDLTSQRDVALKLVQDPARRPQRRVRFQREGEIAASLEHPGIVRVHSLGEWNRCPYLVYELVEDARDLSQAMVGLDRAHRLELIRQAAEALGHAHQRGVVHRDVKPENILVTPAGEARVTDFGLALGRGLERLTQTGGTVGTPYFMAPEQALAQRERVGPATDVWALGVILYAALTDAPPWPGNNLQEVAAQILAARPKPPRRIDSTISPELEAIVLRSLSKEPDERYPDGAALARALVAAARPPRRRTAQVWVGAAACAAAAAVGLALLHSPKPPSAANAGPLPSPLPSLPLGDDDGLPPPTPEPEPATPAPPTDRPLHQAVVPDANRAEFMGETRVLVLCLDRAELWTADLRRRLRRLPKANTQGVSFDGRRILLGLHDDGGLRAYDLDGKELVRSHFGGYVDAVAAHPGASEVIAGLRNPPGLLRLGAAAFLPRQRIGLRASPRHVRFVGKQHDILVTTKLGKVLLFDQRLSAISRAARINGPPYTVTLAPDHTRVLVSDTLGGVYVFRLPSLELEGTLTGTHEGVVKRFGGAVAHPARVLGIEVDAAGQLAWTVSGSHKAKNDLRTWDLTTRRQTSIQLASPGATYGSLDLNPARDRLLIVRRDTGEVSIWATAALRR